MINEMAETRVMLLAGNGLDRAISAEVMDEGMVAISERNQKYNDFETKHHGIHDAIDRISQSVWGAKRLVVEGVGNENLVVADLVNATAHCVQLLKSLRALRNELNQIRAANVAAAKKLS